MNLGKLLRKWNFGKLEFRKIEFSRIKVYKLNLKLNFRKLFRKWYFGQLNLKMEFWKIEFKFCKPNLKIGI